MRDRQDGVPAAQLGEVEVERLELAAEDGGIAGDLGEDADARSQDHERQRQPAKLGREQAAAEPIGRQHERDRSRHPGEVIGGDEGQMQQARQLAEQQVEAEQKDAAVRLAGVGVVPQPGSLRALAHLRQVGGGVVGDEEETGEVMTGRRPQVGEQVGNQRGDGNRDREDQREARGVPRPRRRWRHRPNQRERSSHGEARNRMRVPKNSELATRNTAGSAVWASLNPGWLKPGLTGQRETTSKTISTAARTSVGASGHSRAAIATMLSQITGSRMTRWCGQVTADNSGSSGMKAAERASDEWPRVRQNHQTVRPMAITASNRNGQPKTVHGRVYGFGVTTRRRIPASDWFA